MIRKRFPNWNPVVGERALVPGGPANAQYVDALNHHDIEAIEQGNRGYTPLRVRIWRPSSVEKAVHFSDLLYYDENKSVWCSSNGGTCKTLRGALTAASLYCGEKVAFDADDYQCTPNAQA